MSLKTPVLFIIFNRPDNTQRVFDALKEVKPKRLFIAADGAREHRADDKEKVAATRKILDQIDWDCEVKTLLREQNLGCKMAVSSAIDWFFEHTDKGIILEDDCLAVPEFFNFCERMLTKYEHDTRVMQVCGNCFLEQKFGDGDYFFSVIPHIWGWATWKRAWDLMDLELKTWPTFSNSQALELLFTNKKYSNAWRQYFNDTYKGKIDTWDWQWVYTVICNNGLSITPNHNLVSNIGFNTEGTHTREENHLSNIPTFDRPIVADPTFVFPSKDAIAPIMEHVFFVWDPPFHRKVINKAKEILLPQKEA